MHASIPLLTVAALLWAATSAVAAGTLDAGAATIEIDDRRGHDCSVRTGTLCQADIQTEGDVGTWEVDVNQELDHVTVRTRTPTAVPLLPGEDLTIDFGETRVPHPVFILLDEHVFPFHRNTSYSNVYYGYYLQGGRADLSWNGPSTLDPAPPYEDKHLSVGDANDPHGLNYDYVGAYNRWPNTGTDDNAQSAWFACRLEAGAVCESYDTNQIDHAYGEATPDVRFGLDYYEVTASTADAAAETSTGTQVDAPAEQLAFREPPNDAATVRFVPHEASTVPIGSARPTTRAPGAADPRAEPVATLVASTGTAPAPQEHASSLWLTATAGTSAAFLLITFLALYRRLTRQQLLTQTTREKLLAFVRANPGARTADVARHLNVDRKAVDYHVKMLTKNQIVVTRVVMRQKRIYLNGVQPADGDATLAFAILNHPVAAKIHAAVRDAPDAVGRQELIHALPNVAASTLDFHATRLAKAGLVARVDGRLTAA